VNILEEIVRNNVYIIIIKINKEYFLKLFFKLKIKNKIKEPINSKLFNIKPVKALRLFPPSLGLIK